MKITTNNEQETKKFAQEFAKNLKSGEVICLSGELGAGKTTFVKGLAEGLGISENITSPTFTLMNIYEIKNQQLTINKLIHIDTYRLKNEAELIGIGVEDYLGQPNTISVVEWPEKIENLLKKNNVVNVSIDHLDQNSRIITITD